jgi:alpha-methylacyl-CoA racemase
VTGPLSGLKVIELQGRGPAPFGTMILADLGAEVVTVSRVSDVVTDDEESPRERMLRGHRRIDLVTRGKRSIAVDLKRPDGLAVAFRLIDRADVVVEGNRPGVVERLGLGPEVCLERNPALIYARMTGWGQDGPYAHTPGHDINYVALAGALHHLRAPGQPPRPPLNLLGDYGGGGMLLVIGILGALFERSRSGRGQVVDTAMVDGVALLTTLFYGLRAEGLWSDEPGTNTLDLGSPQYNVYETSDGRYVSVGAGEPQFYTELLKRLGLHVDGSLQDPLDPSTWAAGRERLAAVFKTKTMAEWCEILEGTDTCFAPVISMAEAPRHPHHLARGTFVDVEGVVQPAPAPRFSRTSPASPGGPVTAGRDTTDVLAAWGFERREIDALLEAGAIRQAAP